MRNPSEILAYNIADAGVALGGIKKTKIYELVAEGKLEARAVGGRTVIDAESVRAFYASCPPAPIGPARKQKATE
jgi:excisionase family DNA binding protein